MAPTSRSDLTPRRSARLAKSLKKEFFGTTKSRLSLKHQINLKVEEITTLKLQLKEQTTEVQRLKDLVSALEAKNAAMEKKSKNSLLYAKWILKELS